MSVMSERYTNVYLLRTQDKLTFEQIGDKIGVSRQRAWEIFQRAAKKMTDQAKTSTTSYLSYSASL
jgi:DNA-directed RNA polymerase specialized sigma subunit